MTTVSVPTPAMEAGAAQLLAEPARWTAARRKADGTPFSIVRGRTGVYCVRPDACTCPGFTRRGLCSHSLAATYREAQQAARQADRFTCPARGCHEATEVAGAPCVGCADRRRRLAAELGI